MDLASKHWIHGWLLAEGAIRHEILPGFFALNPHYNTGAVFGVGREHPWIILGLTMIIVPALVLIAYSCREPGAPLWALGLALGGAVGNLYDRCLHPGVRDFIEVGVQFDDVAYRWPVFNVADMGIVAGILLYVGWSLFFAPHQPATTEPASDESAPTEESA